MVKESNAPFRSIVKRYFLMVLAFLFFGSGSAFPASQRFPGADDSFDAAVRLTQRGSFMYPDRVIERDIPGRVVLERSGTGKLIAWLEFRDRTSGTIYSTSNIVSLNLGDSFSENIDKFLQQRGRQDVARFEFVIEEFVHIGLRSFYTEYLVQNGRARLGSTAGPSVVDLSPQGDLRQTPASRYRFPEVEVDREVEIHVSGVERGEANPRPGRLVVETLRSGGRRAWIEFYDRGSLRKIEWGVLAANEILEGQGASSLRQPLRFYLSHQLVHHYRAPSIARYELDATKGFPSSIAWFRRGLFSRTCAYLVTLLGPTQE